MAYGERPRVSYRQENRRAMVEGPITGFPHPPDVQLQVRWLTWAYHDGADLGGPAMARRARDYGYTLAGLRKLQEGLVTSVLRVELFFDEEAGNWHYDSDAETLALDVNVAPAA